MVKTIFRNTFLVGIVVLVLCAGMFFGIQFTQSVNSAYETLRQEAVYAEKGLALAGTDYLASLERDDRVTWIDENGDVLYDNRTGEGIPNQKDDPEVRDAFETGTGHSVRKSGSVGERTVYYAIRCADGTVLRLSRPLSAVQQTLTSATLLLCILVLMTLISIVLAFRAAKQIVKPINEMDLDDPAATPYPELKPLLQRIQDQSLTIREETDQREQMRREFSANVSHELKTPLTSISGFAELMSQGLVPPEKIPEFSGDIYRESQRLINLVDDIMRLSKLDENAVPPDWENVDLYDLASDTIDSLRPAAEKQNVSLRLMGEHLSVNGIRRLLGEMVYNLCDNAVKYNRPGGSVTVTIASSDEGTLLRVADTGIGIPKDKQDRVFERFYRVDKSHSRELGGTGLGLSIVKHGAQFHGAQVRLESDLDSGTVITLVFPK